MSAVPPAIRPLPLFSLDSLAAGWFLVWRVALYTLPFWLIPLIVGFVIVASGWVYQGSIVVCFGIIWGVGAFTRRCGHVTSQWSEKRWGLALLDEDSVWWTLTGHALAGVFGAGMVLIPLTIAAVSGAWPLFLVAVGAQMAASLLAIGWGMSKVAAKQLEGLEPVTDLVSEDEPVSESTPTPQSAEPGEKMQCPKCKLYDTKRGAVIGWYCNVCGWREQRAK